LQPLFADFLTFP